MNKEAWFVYIDHYESWGYGVIAHNFTEAKDMVAKEARCSINDLGKEDHYELDVDVDDLDYGIIDPMIGLVRGIYDQIDETCPVCKKTRWIKMSDEIPGLISCSDCEDKAIQKMVDAEENVEAVI